MYIYHWKFLSSRFTEFFLKHLNRRWSELRHFETYVSVSNRSNCILVRLVVETHKMVSDPIKKISFFLCIRTEKKSSRMKLFNLFEIK